MDENDKLAMYEAMAIAEEKQMEIDQLKREKNELAERLKRLEQGAPQKLGTKSTANLDDVWKAVNDQQQQISANGNRFAQLIQCNTTKISELQSLVSNQKNRIETLEKQLQVKAKTMKTKNITVIPNQPKSTKRTIVVMGGGAHNEMAILNRNSSTWSQVKLKLPRDTAGGGAAYLNEEIYLIGGFSNSKSLLKLDKMMRWIPMANLNIGRDGISNSCVVYNDSIWVFGGRDSKGEELKSVERYDSKKNKWIQMKNMRVARSQAAAAVCNGKIIICGGWNALAGMLKSVESFDPKSGMSTELLDMPSGFYSHSLVTYGPRVVLLGGHRSSDCIYELSLLETVTRWKGIPANRQLCPGFAAVALEEEIYAIGGLETALEHMDQMLIFNGTSWRQGPPLPYKCNYSAALIIPQDYGNTLSSY